jgi:septal ring factor EnvC (AmiA/AmiB activator)
MTTASRTGATSATGSLETRMSPEGHACRQVEVIYAGYPRPHATFSAQEECVYHPAPAVPRSKRRLALLWAASGSILSAVGFLAVTLFEMYNDRVNELERDLKHFNESCATLVKKDDLQRLRDHLRERNQQFQTAETARTQLEREWQAGQVQLHEMTNEVQRLRERLAAVEGRLSATPTASRDSDR